MTTFKLEIETGNDSMLTGADISEALIRCAKNINPDWLCDQPTLKRLIRDVNGNMVGHYLVVDSD
jgi:hypothetical protein